MNDVLRSGLDTIAETVAETVAEVKPRLRGWLHLGTAPLTLAAGIVLVALAPTAASRVGAAIYTLSAVLLFTVSAVYHTGRWSPRVHDVLQRIDHANIFLLIAGSYTPFALLLLDGTARLVLLATVWTGAVLGVLFRVLWIDAPRQLYVPIYMAMGWAALFFLPAFFAGADARFGTTIGTAILVLVMAGGALYTLGGVVYGFKKPNPSPHWFGFHEVFHSFTVLAFMTHYVGVSLATYNLH